MKKKLMDMAENEAGRIVRGYRAIQPAVEIATSITPSGLATNVAQRILAAKDAAAGEGEDTEDAPRKRSREYEEEAAREYRRRRREEDEAVREYRARKKTPKDEQDEEEAMASYYKEKYGDRKTAMKAERLSEDAEAMKYERLSEDAPKRRGGSSDDY